MATYRPIERTGRNAGDESPANSNRRRLLKLVGGTAAAAGLAGCSALERGTSETDGGGGTTTTAQGSDPEKCSRLTSGGYSRYDAKDSPFVATFEHPGSVAVTATVNDTHALTIRTYVGDKQPFDILPSQKLEGTASPTDAQLGNLDELQQVDEIQFGGETVPVVRAAANNDTDPAVKYRKNYPYYLAGLPYEGSNGKQYYRFTVKATVSAADNLSPQVCGPTFSDVAGHLLKSLEPNPDTTVESAGA